MRGRGPDIAELAGIGRMVESVVWSGMRRVTVGRGEFLRFIVVDLMAGMSVRSTYN